MKEKLTNEQVNAVNNYPGAQVDVADGEKITAKAVRERVKTQNNNPRNND